jgi:endonuclease/exonuclease/phosphatase family metal-dependent hydrolase
VQFRVATYNVHKCRGIDRRISVDRIAQVIAAVAPTILAVQEITFLQATELSRRLGVPHVFGETRQLAGDPYGNAVFTALPVLSSESYELTVNGREPRQCLRATLSVFPNDPVHFFSVHLGTSLFERRQQADRLTSSAVLECPEFRGRRIVAGDFNEWTRGRATQMLSQILVSADHARHLRRRTTYPALLPFLHLDHIYYDPRFHLAHLHLERTRTALLASDHVPLVADFTL